MANAPMIVTNTTESTPAVGGIFAGINFFLIQRVPSRSTYVQKVESNGGRVVKLEAQADLVIADHVRKDSPAGSISYKFIDKAIADGTLPDPKDHTAGPVVGTVRPAGSAIPGKSTRTRFTPEDDRVLWQWVQRLAGDGYMVKGNEIYKQLEAQNNRHTYQAWRDRYIKRMMDGPPPGVEVTVTANAPPSPPTAPDEQSEITEAPVEMRTEPTVKSRGNAAKKPTKAIEQYDDGSVDGRVEAAEPDEDSEPDFTERDFNDLLSSAEDIEEVPDHDVERAWAAWSTNNPQHSAEAWHTFYREIVRPEYLQQRRAERIKAHNVRKSSRSACGTAEMDEGRFVNETESLEKRAVQLQTQTPSPSEQQKSIAQKRKRDVEAPTAVHHTSRKRPRAETEHAADAPHASEEGLDQVMETARLDMNGMGALSNQPIELLSSDENSKEEETDGDLLTEANLASQQVQGKTGVLRGGDLLEDDLANDIEKQQEYISYLQSIVKPSGLPDLIDDLVQDPQTVTEMPGTEAELPSQGVSLGLDDFELSPIRDLPMSSQQEIDDAFEGTINWPESPRISQRPDSQFQVATFETQIPYPKLPSQQPDVVSEPMIPSQSTVVQQVSYPSLSAEAREPETQQSAQPQPGSLDDEQVRRSASPALERESGYTFVRNEKEGEEEEEVVVVEQQQPQQQSVASPREAIEQDIDLSIPEPESGWDLPSSRGRGGKDIEIVHEEEEIVALSSASSPSSSSGDERAKNAHRYGRAQKVALETQDIMNAETQRPDLEVPPPPESDEEDFLDYVGRPASDGESTPKQATRRSFSSSKASSQRAWTTDEDDLLLRGFRNGLSATEVANVYVIDRTPSSVRNRRQLLLKRFPDRAIAQESHMSHDKLAADQSEQSFPSSALPSSPSMSATSESQRNLPGFQKLPDDDVDSYVDKMIVFGYEEESIINALKSTSMRPDLADLVLLEGKSRKHLPRDIAGIWSENEDRILESGDAKGLRKLEEKHTWDECLRRMHFLQEWREED